MQDIQIFVNYASLSRHTVEREEECLIFQLAHSAHLWNVRLLCTDGPLEQVSCWQCCESGSVCFWASGSGSISTSTDPDPSIIKQK